jgi:hypothetical protein
MFIIRMKILNGFMYSSLWPSNKNNKRRLPIVKSEYNKSIKSDVK